MDDTVVNQPKNEMVQAIAAAISSDPNVEACRAKARAAGLEIHLSLEAELGFASRGKGQAPVQSPARRVRLGIAGRARSAPTIACF